MSDNSDRGFTIIEVILFLALTALFMMIAFAGISGRSGQVQFTDSMRSLASYLQRQYSDTLNGVNIRDNTLGCQYAVGGGINFSSSEPGRSECTVMGKAVVFSDGSDAAGVYVIVGRFLTQTVDSSDPNYLDPSLSDIDLIMAAEPVVLKDQLDEVYDLEWQSQFVEPSGLGPSAIAFIRSPRSSNIYPITFRPNWSGSTPALDISNIGVNANYCFVGANGQDAEIIVGGSNRADGIELAFDTGCS